jgi:hypothetical protein
MHILRLSAFVVCFLVANLAAAQTPDNVTIDNPYGNSSSTPAETPPADNGNATRQSQPPKKFLMRMQLQNQV